MNTKLVRYRKGLDFIHIKLYKTMDAILKDKTVVPTDLLGLIHFSKKDLLNTDLIIKQVERQHHKLRGLGATIEAALFLGKQDGQAGQVQ